MVEMQESISILTSQLDKCNVAGSADSPKSPHEEEVNTKPEDSQLQNLRGTPDDEHVSQTPISQLELIPGDLILNPQTLMTILDYSYSGDQLRSSLMLWPFGIIHNDPEEHGVFCNHDKIFDALRSRDVGLVSKCLAWICLLLSQLPRDFKDVETGLPLYPEDFIDRILTQVSILYLADCTPACSIDSIEALVLQYELFIAIGRPSKAWKCVRAGIENALLLGLHLRQNLVWDALWIRDRQISLIIGLPYGTPNSDIDTTAVLEPLRKIGLVSGLISDRDRLRQDTPFSIMTSIVDEMKELKIMIPDEWAETDLNLAFSPIGHAIMRLYKHTLNIMIHLPYSQFASYDKQFEYTRIEVLESAEGAIRAHRDIRSLQDRFQRCDLFDFLAFNAAVMLIADLAAKETPRTMEEEERIWTVITDFVNMLRKTGEVLENATADQAADVLEILHAAYKGRYRGQLYPYQVTIPYFGRISVSRQAGESEAAKTTVEIEIESSVYTFRVPPNEKLTKNELTDDWTKIDLYGSYGWRGIYTFADGVSGLPYR
ncbi:hypothetical protein FPOA_04532 [Fusarium poae]|uniref:Transcription factor domain-containing protein n=1 Tax=Fusarium poae TaxID=36050 RepID=A0A1B8AUE6_FUSPO|nr:hypothetical protein FPOA_04532 [Fusarium poae]